MARKRPRGRVPEGRFEGHLEQLAQHLSGAPDAKITDLRQLLTTVEGMLPGMASAHRRPFAAMHIVFNALLSSDLRLASAPEMDQHYHQEFEAPSPEAMVLNLLFERDPARSVEEHREALDQYFKRRSRSSGARYPALFEAGMTLHLAERYRTSGQPEEARKLIAQAVDNNPGQGSLRQLEDSFDPATPIIWRKVLLPPQQH